MEIAAIAILIMGICCLWWAISKLYVREYGLTTIIFPVAALAVGALILISNYVQISNFITEFSDVTIQFERVQISQGEMSANDIEEYNKVADGWNEKLNTNQKYMLTIPTDIKRELDELKPIKLIRPASAMKEIIDQLPKP